MVAVLVLRDNTASFPRRRESMIAVLVLLDNTASFPRRRESTGRYSELYRSFHFSFVGWAKRSVPNALDASIPDVCQSTCLNCQTAKSESPHTVFQVAGHACVECFLGFACHDVEGGLFHDRCIVMDSRLRGNDGGEFCGNDGGGLSRNGRNPWLLFSFSMIILSHSRVGGNPWLLCSFSMITLCHSRAGGNPSNTTAAPM